MKTSKLISLPLILIGLTGTGYFFDRGENRGNLANNMLEGFHSHLNDVETPLDRQVKIREIMHPDSVAHYQGLYGRSQFVRANSEYDELKGEFDGHNQDMLYSFATGITFMIAAAAGIGHLVSSIQEGESQ